MTFRSVTLSFVLTASLAGAVFAVRNSGFASFNSLPSSSTKNSSLYEKRDQASAADRTYRWAGPWMPMRISAGDGITELDTKIGRFIHFPDKQDYVRAIRNINSKFPGSTPWATWTVSDLSRAIPTGSNLTEAQHEEYLSMMDQHGVQVFLEIFPYSTDPRKKLPAVDATTEIDKWLSKLKHHTSVVGVGIELEYFGKATDSLAAEWNKTIKRHNPKYRMFLRHYSKDFMPPKYRGTGDLIFICDASESTIPELNVAFASWANHFAPTACAFQIGYPADEDGMNGSNDLGWWRLKDPVREWGDGILPLIKDEQQEIGLIWVTAKSGKSYHKDWDITR